MKVKIISIFLGLIFLASCSEEVAKKLENLPRALGKSNEIIVLCDQNMWDGPVGDSIVYYYQSAYPIMPSPEPVFDLRHFSYQDIDGESLRKQLRTYMVVCNLSDTESKITQMVRKDMGEERYRRALEDPEFKSSVGKDKWARGQMIIYLFANNDESLIQNIKQSFPAIAKRVNTHDENQIKSTAYVTGVNIATNNKILDKFEVNMQIPADFVIAKEDEEERMLWLRKDTKDATLNIVIEKLNYKDESQFSSDQVKSVINDFGKKHISSTESNTYLQVNDEDLPLFQYERRINDNYTSEVRGIWEMVNDFMGGPFAAYMIHDSTRNEVLLINTFIYAPGKTKRNMMQELEYVVKSVKINS